MAAFAIETDIGAKPGALGLAQSARGFFMLPAKFVVRDLGGAARPATHRGQVAVLRAAVLSTGVVATGPAVTMGNPVEYAAVVTTFRLVDTVRPCSALPGRVTGSLAFRIIKSLVLALGRVVVSAAAFRSPLNREVRVIQLGAFASASVDAMFAGNPLIQVTRSVIFEAPDVAHAPAIIRELRVDYCFQSLQNLHSFFGYFLYGFHINRFTVFRRDAAAGGRSG